jgi:hypothetical protein
MVVRRRLVTRGSIGRFDRAVLPGKVPEDEHRSRPAAHRARERLMATSGGEHGNRLMDVVAAEGRELEEVFGRIEAETTEPAERRRLADEILQRLTGHAAARREVLYPRVSRDVPNGDSAVDLAILGLDQIERTSKELTDLSGGEPSFLPLVKKLATEVWEHLDEEESEVLPALVDAVGVDAANELGDELARAGAAAAR